MDSRSHKAFTIIELLVAIGVTAMLVTLMVSVVNSVLNNWNRSSGMLSTGNIARLVLDQVSQDLQGAIMKTDGNVWLAATIQTTAQSIGIEGETLPWPNRAKPDNTGSDKSSTSLILDPSQLNPEETSDLTNYRFGQAGVWLRFFTIPVAGDKDPVTDDPYPTAPRAVSYQLTRRQVGGSTGAYAYQLFRSEVKPDQTFDAGYNLYDGTSEYNTVPGAVANDGAKSNIRSPLPKQVIASSVVDFGVRFYEKYPQNSNQLIEIFPVDRRAGKGNAVQDAFAATSRNVTADPGGGSSIQIGFPVVAEVMIRVLTPEGVKLIEAKEDPLTSEKITDDWWDIVKKIPTFTLAGSRSSPRRFEEGKAWGGVEPPFGALRDL